MVVIFNWKKESEIRASCCATATHPCARIPYLALSESCHFLCFSCSELQGSSRASSARPQRLRENAPYAAHAAVRPRLWRSLHLRIPRPPGSRAILFGFRLALPGFLSLVVLPWYVCRLAGPRFGPALVKLASCAELCKPTSHRPRSCPLLLLLPQLLPN